MDMYTLFAITMTVVAFGALLLAILNLHYARTEIRAHREFLRMWFDRVADEYDSHKLTQGRVQTALADRVRNLETYRRNHAERLNHLEDGRAEPQTEADYVAMRNGDNITTDPRDDHSTSLQRRTRALDCADLQIDEYAPRTRMVDQDADILAAREREHHDAQTQAQVERRFLQGL